MEYHPGFWSPSKEHHSAFPTLSCQSIKSAKSIGYTARGERIFDTATHRPQSNWVQLEWSDDKVITSNLYFSSSYLGPPEIIPSHFCWIGHPWITIPAGTMLEFSFLLGIVHQSSGHQFSMDWGGNNPLKSFVCQESIPPTGYCFLPFLSSQSLILRMLFIKCSPIDPSSLLGVIFFPILYTLSRMFCSPDPSPSWSSVLDFCQWHAWSVGPRCGCQSCKVYSLWGRLSRTFIFFILITISINAAE